MPVRELLSRIDSKELTEWRAYFRVKGELEKKARDNKPPLEANIKGTMTGYGK